MIKKGIHFFFLFLGSVLCTYANGFGDMSGKIEVLPESQRHKGFEEQYNIKVAPISFPGTASYDFVYIDSETILIIAPYQLIMVNLTNGEQVLIDPPEVWENIYYNHYIEPIYDRANNTIHTRFRVSGRGINRSTYYILHLEDYTWEAINEFGNDFSKHWYDSENGLIYVEQNKTNEFDPNKVERDSEGFVIRIITVFDLHNRKVIDNIELPRWTRYVLCMYGKPMKILASVQPNNNEERNNFFIFDTETKTSTFYKESMENIMVSNVNINSLSSYIAVSNDDCFLGIDLRRENKSAIVQIDLKSNGIETHVLVDFSYQMYNLKKIAEGKYGFMFSIRTGFGGHGPSYLCFLDYP